MALTTYTTNDTIRAILGVSPREIKDETLALAIFEQQFLLEMSAIDNDVGGAVTQYTTVAAVPAEDRTTAQQQYFDIVGMYAAYSVARQVLTGAPFSVVQKITDGKAEIERFSSSNFDRVREGVDASCAQIMRRLKSLLSTLDPSVSSVIIPDRVFMLNVGLGVDPVTGV